ncbi:hypothetical protein [Bradyrhizobium liaoningense]|uniref:hypothetical protein n=1 Tax=Bradyrhizobium liaoningense TaxID=43992 RepID=UPI001BA72E4E|nr:hypothetical protein [Bradyrhizobium liaoningense]MBR0822415.1 hypothetical protein [Bradyrhizobium liaoningense]
MLSELLKVVSRESGIAHCDSEVERELTALGSIAANAICDLLARAVQSGDHDGAIDRIVCCRKCGGRTEGRDRAHGVGVGVRIGREVAHYASFGMGN